MVNLKDIYIRFYPKGIINDISDNIDLSSFIDNVQHWFYVRYSNDIRSIFNNFERYEFKRCSTDNYKFELTFYNVDFDVRVISLQFIKNCILDIDSDGEYPMYFGYDRIEFNGENYDYVYLLGNPDSAVIQIVDAISIEDL